MVALVCESGARSLIVAWRYLAGTASGQSREAAATHAASAVDCNTAQVDRTPGSQRLADKGIRCLRQSHRRALGAAPVVVDLAGAYGVIVADDLLALPGAPACVDLLPRAPGTSLPPSPA